MKRVKRGWRGLRLWACIILVDVLGGTAVQAGCDPCDWAFVRLDYARNDKVEQLRHFCDRIHGLASHANDDPIMLSCFQINRDYDRMTEHAAPPAELTAKVEELRVGLREHYLQNYLVFYDILFVDRNGKVFFTIRNESDRHKNLVQGQVRAPFLQRCLAGNPQVEQFVDFAEYGPSAEPAAFFVEPVMLDGDLAGWVVLQLAINKVNSLFAWNEELGQTGETFLVNESGYMLTESNFEGSSTVLAKRLDDRNIQAKFTEGEGHRSVTDYRGFSALTSFEVVEFMGTRWLVVAKMDKDQVITEHYQQHRRYCADRLLERLRAMPLTASEAAVEPAVGRDVRVDIDEFIKADNDECLETFGVSTCTGLLAVYPGCFAYLAHISPRDRMYGQDGANLLGQLIKKIRSFDMYPCERRNVQFLVVAPHLDSLVNIVDKIVEEGFLLSQIKVLYKADAYAASVAYDFPRQDLSVFWRGRDSSQIDGINHLEDAVSVSGVMDQIMVAEDKDITMQYRQSSTSKMPETTL